MVGPIKIPEGFNKDWGIEANYELSDNSRIWLLWRHDTWTSAVKFKSEQHIRGQFSNKNGLTSNSPCCMA